MVTFAVVVEAVASAVDAGKLCIDEAVDAVAEFGFTDTDNVSFRNETAVLIASIV